MRILLLLSLFMTFNSFASDHSEDKAVLAAVEKYYAARTAEDFATQVAMESKSGVYSTNSDGSFHKPVQTLTVADYEKNAPIGLNHVYFPEAVKLSDDAYSVSYTHLRAHET